MPKTKGVYATNITRKRKKEKARKVPVKFTIDCSVPASDGIIDVASFERFLRERIKVDGRTGKLSDAVNVTRTNHSIVIEVLPGVRISKRYLKYLTKRFLKKNRLRDWVRVIAISKNTYELRYFNIAEPEGGEGVEEE
ncbi:uncharacterized protein SPPG_03832 [Spizellomyces punctatus DAOM BR117]|uniref:Large ribosomal subunit protein eL22 n=1 Tax=Spizellomyces punctatus (strain DAOM BR117) TaxID=645134 RepID=A0A0L0HIR4_SPIPD|nr:uncharacterized protein SPPG_03832 [Spizellomyces punctatus DAOM BR117]KND00714.1 hypothetical protein SPPG_03832 [Spizellomyces punctatus DAOM BR117]|eukprot:XP_016608753.1 hypothetical protein SPPG_03832 [Spizellomyces punctatus DAOM BR117]